MVSTKQYNYICSDCGEVSPGIDFKSYIRIIEPYSYRCKDCSKDLVVKQELLNGVGVIIKEESF